MDCKIELEFLNRQIIEAKQEIVRMINELEKKLTDLEAQKVRLEDEIYINVKEESENNSINQNVKYSMPNFEYKVPNETRSIKQKLFSNENQSIQNEFSLAGQKIMETNSSILNNTKPTCHHCGKIFSQKRSLNQHL